MEKHNLPNDVKVFGHIVTNFPNGIKEAFDSLVNVLPEGDTRPYYGLSECTANGIIYKAAALETFEGEGAQYGFETYTVEKGEYLSQTITGWMQKIGSIKNVFQKMLEEKQADHTKPCVEIYWNDDEMVCLVKAKSSEGLSNDVEKTFDQLIGQLSLFDEQAINTIPFEGSWTPGQLAQHMILSNGGFLEMLNGPIKETQRAPDEQIPAIKSTFLDFTKKFQSPDFIVPEEKDYDKAELLSTLESIKQGIVTAAQNSDLRPTCTAFEIPGVGFLTRLEAVHFSMYHTQRHTQQLKNMFGKQ